MAAISVTAANVGYDSGASIGTYTAGATITAGQLVYLDTTVNTVKLCDSDASLAASTLLGVAMNGASSGQPINVLTDGTYTAGGTVAIGVLYTAGPTAGAIIPVADLANPSYASFLGIGTTAAKIKVHVLNSLVVVA